MQLTTLTQAQADHFIERGYVAIPDCLDPELARQWTDRAYRRLGYDAGAPATWREEIVWLDRHTTAPVREISPRGWGALCDVVGGEERIDPQVYEIESGHFTTIDSFEWSDAFIVNFRRGADRPWQAPCAAAGGWHKDGSYFRHFLDSREQALLIVLREPMLLQRSDPAGYSLLERATLHALGVDHYDFRPTVPRESYWQVRQTG